MSRAIKILALAAGGALALTGCGGEGLPSNGPNNSPIGQNNPGGVGGNTDFGDLGDIDFGDLGDLGDFDFGDLGDLGNLGDLGDFGLGDLGGYNDELDQALSELGNMFDEYDMNIGSSLPDGFPSGIPLPNATLVSSFVIDGSYTLSYQSNGAGVAKQTADQMASQGFTLIEHMNMFGMEMWMLQGSGWDISVSEIADDSGFGIVTIIVAPLN